ncbi:MAG: rRNA maturation RNase YbeY [bacterium]|nr:rRNA maturation RNase YbeY [bacterium]
MIEIQNLTRESIPLAFLRKAAESVLRKEKKSGRDLSVAIVDEERMKEISRAYKGKKDAANVLSFPMKEFGLGEVVLCKKAIAKDAKNYGITVQQGMAFMMAHGILHLLGYSHKAMESKESAILSQFK